MQKIPPKYWALSHYEGSLIPIFLGFAVGMALAYVLPAGPWVKLPLVVSCLCILAGLICWTERRWVIRGALIMGALLVGALYFSARSFQPGEHDVSQWNGSEAVEIQGMLVMDQPEKHQAQLRVSTVNQQSASGTLLFHTGQQVMPPLGATLRLTGDLTEPSESLIPGGFDQKRYLLSQKITAILRHATVLQVISEEPTTPEGHFLRFVEQLRQQISSLLKQALPSPEAEILGGIVLGDRAIPVDRETRQAFIHTGLIHVLAASGLNVGIVGGFVLWIGLRVRMPRRFRLLLAMGAVAVYALLTGLPPSIQRAGAMLELALLLKLLDKTLSPLMLLSVGVFLLLLVNPDAIGSLGFQFSVLTTFGLITMVPALQEWLGFYMTKWLSGLILVPLVAQLWVLPLSIYHFNQFPIHSIPLNIGALAMVAPLTAIGFTAGFFSLLWKPLGLWISLAAWPFLKGLIWIVQWGDGMTWAQWTVASPLPVVVFCQYLSLLGAAYLIVKPLQGPVWRQASVCVACLLVAILPVGLQRFVESGQSTLTLLPLPYRQTAYVLQPAGSAQALVALPSDSGYWQGRAVMDYCRHRNFKPLAGVVLLPATREEGDNPGVGVQKLLESQYVQAGQTRVFSTPFSQRLQFGNTLFWTDPQGLRISINGITLLPAPMSSVQAIWRHLNLDTYLRFTFTEKSLSVQTQAS